MNKISEARLAEMLDGLEGVTPGPWKMEGSIYEHMGAGIRSIPDDRGFAQLWKSGTVALDAKHIARCDPDTIRSLIEEVQQSRTTADTEQDGKGVKVKGLEWDDQWAEHRSISGRTRRRIMERALTPFTAYFIEQSADDDSWWLLEQLLGDEIGGPFEHDWQARAAAQADFDRRVLSSLSSAPQQEAVAWVVANGNDDRWRVWENGECHWTDDRSKATRFARREDAEAVHFDDEDAWRVYQCPTPSQDGVVTEEMVERACQAYFEAYPDRTSRAGEQGMRAALEAALNKGGE